MKHRLQQQRRNGINYYNIAGCAHATLWHELNFPNQRRRRAVIAYTSASFTRALSLFFFSLAIGSIS